MYLGKRHVIAALVIGALLVLALVPMQGTDAKPQAELQYEIRASQARLNRLVTASVTDSIDGIPAAPVHSFVWDGDGSVPLKKSKAKVTLDPVYNTGEIDVRWTDPDGNKWTLKQTVFFAPGHASGLRLTTAGTTELVNGDPIPVDVYLHGDTTAGGPVLPTIFNNLASWGAATVTLNGEPFDNPYDGPTPLWVTHTMLTAGVRNDDGTVRVADGSFYNPTMQGQPGAIDYDDLEYHVVFHDAPGPELTNNFPPPFSFFYHLTFESVEFEIEAGE